MARIADFNIGCSKHEPKSQSQCSVVIHNNNQPTPTKAAFPDRVTYPTIDATGTVKVPNEDFVSVMPNAALTRSVYTGEEKTIDELGLYKLIAHTFAVILKDTNSKLIANIIDNSGKIIIDATSLCQIIGLICGVDATKVHIEYVLKEEGGCMAKVNPIKQIENIKIDYLDFKLAYNSQYNILADQYHISLRKVIVGGY